MYTCRKTRFRQHSQLKVCSVCVCVCARALLCTSFYCLLSAVLLKGSCAPYRAHPMIAAVLTGTIKVHHVVGGFLLHQLHHYNLRPLPSHTLQVPRMILSTNSDLFLFCKITNKSTITINL